jgi:1-acyl-sn-glycerol-3-phosphate acyltransferase
MAVASKLSSPFATPPTIRDVLCRPIPDSEFGDRCLLRALAVLGLGQLKAVFGLEHVAPANDPFILVLNHSTRREALLVPALLMLYRGGCLIHFMADWNYRLIPGVGSIYQRAQTISVTRKSARPQILNLLKPLYLENSPVLVRARALLLSGRSVGIFPEGRVNRNRYQLLKGRMGPAYLSLETGVPIIPARVRLPDAQPGRSPPHYPLETCIGHPLRPPSLNSLRVPNADLRAWHTAIMGEISRYRARHGFPLQERSDVR